MTVSSSLARVKRLSLDSRLTSSNLPDPITCTAPFTPSARAIDVSKLFASKTRLILMTAMNIALSLSLVSQANADDGAWKAPAVRSDVDWSMYGSGSDATHYSPLGQINQANVHALGLLWYYDIPPVVSVQAAPLAINGVLYFATGYSVIHAMDARTGKLLWRYDPEVYKFAGSSAMRAAWGIRGIAFLDGRIYTGTHDGRLIALDAQTGKPAWSVQTTTPNDGRYITGAPLVFKDTVIIGHAGADYATIRGYVTAYDARTGKLRWRFYTVPGEPGKKDGAASDTVLEKLAQPTWRGEWWKFGGGGTVWNAMTYDRKFNQVYLGTGNGFPWNQKIRSPGGGDNLFLASIVALDADTGEYRWHYQVNPGETWDYNAAMDMELAELVIDGRQRSVLLQAPKNGFFYVIDRESGELVSAEKIARVNWATSVDLKSGRPVENPDARYADGKTFVLFPSQQGAHNIQTMSFNPGTGLAYIPVLEFGMPFVDPPDGLGNWTPKPNWVLNGGVGSAVGVRFEPPISGLLAWNPATRQEIWRKSGWPGMFHGGTITTAGNLVFQGRADGSFFAYAADSGKELWRFDAQAGIVSQPISYQVGGRQLITLIAGYRGFGGPSGYQSEWDYYTQQRRVLTFALDATLSLPPQDRSVREFIDAPSFTVEASKAIAGASVFATYCARCHGANAQSGGAAPDLRKSLRVMDFAAIKTVVQGGASMPRGMPQFAEFNDSRIEELQHFIIREARSAKGDVRSGK